jgi:hypothetical protein
VPPSSYPRGIIPRNYHPWTEADEHRLRALLQERLPARVIAQRMDRSTASVTNKMTALGLLALPRFSDDDPAVQEWESKRDAAIAEVDRRAETYEWLRPVNLPAPPKVKVTSKPSAFTLVAGDFHFGMEDQRAIALFLASVEALKPKRIILNGDTVDLLAVSRYPKDVRKGKTWSLQDEVIPFHAFLKALHEIGDSWGMEIVETEANHSGNGTAGRWWRYLNDRCPELLGHARAEEFLSYERWFFPEWSTIKLVDSVMIADDLMVLHGDMVRGEAAYTAKATREKWMNSVLVNHTHRMGFAPKTITAHAGRPTSYVRAYENGCMCKLEVPYGVALNWQQGFAVICEDANLFSVEQVFVDNGQANIAALGKTLRAA